MSKERFLGQQVAYPKHYDAGLLTPIARDQQYSTKADGIMQGHDVWFAYELSWLGQGNKPVVAIAKITVPANSPNIIESKSLKLYLNGYNFERFNSIEAVQTRIQADLSQAAEAQIEVELALPSEQKNIATRKDTGGFCLDDLPLELEEQDFEYSSAHLKPEAGEQIVEQRLYSHLLRSNCPVTNQPDWATIVIDYKGQAINKQSLLHYIIAYREHQGFHEQVVEQMFEDIWNRFELIELTVIGQYTRRGGIDINPIRSSLDKHPNIALMYRQ